MTKLASICHGCLFAEVENNIQLGCSIGVLDKMEKAGSSITTQEMDGVTYKVVDRVCPYKSYGDVKQPKVCVNFVIVHDVAKASSRDLQVTIDSLNNVEDSDTCKVIICHNGDPKEILSISRSLKIPTEIVWILDELYENQIYDESFRRCRNGYVTFSSSGRIIRQNVVNALFSAIYVRFHKVLHVQGNDDELETYLAVLYKYLKGNREMPIKDKLNGLLADEAGKFSFTWEEINACLDL